MKYSLFFRLVLSCAVLLPVVMAGTAGADGPDLHAVAFEQKLDAQVPLDLRFRNERNQEVALRDLISDKPIVLTLNYLRCENLCPLELDDLAKTLAKLSFEIGDEFDVLTVSIDARETPIIAANKRMVVLQRYGRPEAEDDWHFLTGTEESIQALTDTVGFYYAYDAKTDDFAHPTGVIVLTPSGRVARYLYGVGYTPRDVRLALVEASQHRIGNPVDQVFLFCFAYDAAQGRYTGVAMNFVQIGAFAGFLVLGGFVGTLWWMEKRRRTPRL